jgi:Ni,Fe-hydrogenase III component G
MLEKEEAIRQKLETKFDFMKDKCVVKRERRLWAEAPREKLLDVVAYLKNDLGFGSLCTITALDSGENYVMIYHLANVGIMLNLKAAAPKTDPVFDTVTGLFEGATLYELEAHNLLGIDVRGIPEGIRYPLPDCWPDGQYPLRKDWKKEAPASSQEGS